MSAIAPTLEAFFTDRLVREKKVSSHTVAAYRDTFRLLVCFAERRAKKAPSALQFEDLNATAIAEFLEHLECERHNSVRTRNARLAAIRSFYRYAARRNVEHAELIQRVLAIPQKRYLRTDVSYLDDKEVEALLVAPDDSTFLGRRDRAILQLAVQTGLRVSELTSLTCADIVFGNGAFVHCIGKGRKERVTPLTKETVATLRSWTRERAGAPDAALFVSAQGDALGRAGVARLLAKHVRTASKTCASLQTKTVSPHVLRHTAAMRLLHAGVDTSVIALWLGHESVETTMVYIHADLALKERALARTAPVGSPPGRFQPTDQLLAFLEAL
jgi:integrase/recombinase XerD